MSIRVLLVEEHKTLREGLYALLKNQFDMEVVGKAENGRTAVHLSKELLPDVVIMDVIMPDLSGFEATRQIIAEAPVVKVIVLSMYSDKQFVTGIFEAGASGYVLKECAFEEVADAIRKVAAGEVYVGTEIADV
ncbi:MAG: response regulator transcription factor [bacterium]